LGKGRVGTGRRWLSSGQLVLIGCHKCIEKGSSTEEGVKVIKELKEKCGMV
jgi:hypothetical protein